MQNKTDDSINQKDDERDDDDGNVDGNNSGDSSNTEPPEDKPTTSKEPLDSISYCYTNSSHSVYYLFIEKVPFKHPFHQFIVTTAVILASFALTYVVYTGYYAFFGFFKIVIKAVLN